jgi:hypothetical protein
VRSHIQASHPSTYAMDCCYETGVGLRGGGVGAGKDGREGGDKEEGRPHCYLPRSTPVRAGSRFSGNLLRNWLVEC